MLSVVKVLLKGEVGGHALVSHVNYIVDHGIVFLNFCGNPVRMLRRGEVGCCALNDHGNYIIDHGKIVEFCF